MSRKLLLMITAAVLLPALVLAQGTLTGTVTDAESGEPLVGANVYLEGTSFGSATDLSGAYTIGNVPVGTYQVTSTVIGYVSTSNDVQIAAGIVTTSNFSLSGQNLEMSALEVLASRAGKNTPVAYSNVSKEEMQVRLGSQDIPLVLNTTPSVYATNQGGGAGDARINVRGFNQRNVAVMINGVPQNDMENGWVYWSNWDGVGDATSSIQMQRGLSAVNLATPSIGGTMNIITDPSALSTGGGIQQEVGSGGFSKTSLSYNTGLLGDKMALSTVIVRKTGEGIVDRTWTDAWAYYFGGSYAISADNRFELYALGAPQRHGQNRYMQNIAAYDSTYAKSIDGFDEGAIDRYTESDKGHNYNENVSDVSSSYKGQQYWYMYGEGGMFGGGLVDRHDPDYLNEIENFFHKPLVNLNHFWNLSESMRLSTILYWSGGSGGGTGTYGDITWDYSGPTRVVDYNKTIAVNLDSLDRKSKAKTLGVSNAILRNSVNRQNTYGAISKLNFDVSDALKLQAGIDWRTAEIEHAREVRDLLGGSHYVDYADANFASGHEVGLGDIIAYHNTTTVDWIGTFLQGDYTAGSLSVYGMGGVSSIVYSNQNHFTVANEKVIAPAISATQFKGGAMFNLQDNFSVFGNFGIVGKPPILDNVIDSDGAVSSDPINEKFVSAEMGLNFNAGMFAVTANVYNTNWKDRNLTRSVVTGAGDSGDTDIIYLTGVNQTHQGLEIEASAQLMDMLRIDAAVSLGNWKFDEDAVGEYKNEAGDLLGTYNYALKELFVGDMPQTSFVFGATVTPMKGLRLQVIDSYYTKNYANWSPTSRSYDTGTAEADIDREQVWEAPSYNKMDIHASYNLPKIAGLDLNFFVHVFNALDATYVQDALDNSPYNGYGGTSHDADNAEVFLGTERFFNTGIKIRF